MKTSLILLLAVAATVQAVEWAGVQSRFLQVPDSGYRSTTNHGRIVGGSQATRHEFPYQAALFLRGSDFCGGSLITDSVVLTAAHCVEGNFEIEVHFGAQSINNPNEVDRVISLTRNRVIHDAWNIDELNNDIALVMLTAPVSGNGIETVRLPSRTQEGTTFEGFIGRTTGWGRISDLSPNISPELNYVDMIIVSNSIVCGLFYGNLINPSKMCTDTEGGTLGTCTGDAGGPMVIYELDGLPTQVGVASFHSSAGCEVGAPVVYTRLTSYLDWLEFNAGVTIRP